MFTPEVSDLTSELPVPELPLDVVLVLPDFVVPSLTLYLEAKSLQQGNLAKHRAKPVLKDLKRYQKQGHEFSRELYHNITNLCPNNGIFPKWKEFSEFNEFRESD